MRLGTHVPGGFLRQHEGMENELRRTLWSVAPLAVLLLANLTVLMVVAVSISVQDDLDVTTNSATPVTDGTVTAIVVVMALALLNGVLLSLSPRTRRYGVGVLIAVVASIPVGIFVSLFALGSLLNDT